jgi:hypothetical protein
LPRKTQNLSANAAKLPIRIIPARTSWTNSGHALAVSFDIQYVGTDHGSQQGRIIVLARGPNALLAYPEGVLGPSAGESLISPNLGEYFSVSRFREVKAVFPEARGNGPIHEVEILIVSLEGHLLFDQKLPAAAAPAARPVPAKKPSPSASPLLNAPVTPGTSAATPAAPRNDASEIIEPGVDQ